MNEQTLGLEGIDRSFQTDRAGKATRPDGTASGASVPNGRASAQGSPALAPTAMNEQTLGLEGIDRSFQTDRAGKAHAS
jgi:hypothetical protein